MERKTYLQSTSAGNKYQYCKILRTIIIDKYFFVLLAVLLFFISIFIIGCSNERTEEKIPKVFLTGDKEDIYDFNENYRDSLSLEAGNLIDYILNNESTKKILLNKNSDKQAWLLAKWGINNQNFDIQWKSAVFFLVNHPLTALPKVNSTIETGLYSKVDSIRLFALHLASHYSLKQTYLIRQKLENLFDRLNPDIPQTLFEILKNKYLILQPEKVGSSSVNNYPGIEIDSLFNRKELALKKIITWPELYLWDWLVLKDSSFIENSSIDELFPFVDPEIQYIFWKCYNYFRIDPISKLKGKINPDSLLRSSPIRLKNAILGDFLSPGYIVDKYPLISSWLEDTTFTDIELKRIIAKFPEDPPGIYFKQLYELLDNTFLQKKSLKLITAMDDPKIDRILLEKLQNSDEKELPKVIYVIGFRKIKRGLPLLENLLNHKNEVIRFNANEAINRIKGSNNPR